MLYERAKQLQAKRLSAEEIRATLLEEGAKPEDVQVILGSLGFGAQPQPGPPRPLGLVQRTLESRPLRLAVFVFGAATAGGVGYLAWALIKGAIAIVRGLEH